MGVRLGGRGVQRAAQRGDEALLPGGDRRGRSGPEVDPGHRGRGARIHPELAGRAAGSEETGHERSETGDRGRCHGVLVGARPGLSGGPAPALLGAQDRQRAGRHAEGHPSQGEVGTAADPDGGDPGPGRPGLRPFPGPLPGQVSQGRGEADPGSQGTDELLRLPGRALAEHSHHQPDRVDLCHDPPPDPDDPGLPEPRHHARHDVQARPERGIPLAKAARVPQAGTGHRGSAIQGRN